MKSRKNIGALRTRRVSALKNRILAVISAIIMVLGYSPMVVHAAPLTNNKDTLQTSAHNTLSQHVFQFTTATSLTTDGTSAADFSFVINFPLRTAAGTDAFGASVPTFVAGDFAATCTSCSSQLMDVTAVEQSSNGGSAADDEFLIALNETGEDSNPLPAGSVVTLTFGASSGAQRLTNPTEDQADSGCTVNAGAGVADVCSITIGTSENITGTAPTIVDTADVLVALLTGTQVSVTVDESLTFSVAGETAANCDDEPDSGGLAGGDYIATTATGVAFGSIPTETFKAGCQLVTVGTNASAGYNVTAQENTSLLSGSFTLNDTTCDGGTPCDFDTSNVWATATNNGLGYWCADQSNTPCDASVDENTEYKSFACTGSDANCDPSTGGEAAQVVMTEAGPASGSSANIHFKLSVDAAQEAGSYSNTVTYVVTPIF